MHPADQFEAFKKPAEERGFGAEEIAAFGELEAEIERLEAKRQAYDSANIPRCGAFVILNHDGEPGGDTLDPEDEDGDGHKPLSDILIRDLTAHSDFASH